MSRPEETPTDHAIEGPYGDIPVRTYPAVDPADGRRVGIIWLHGGAWMWGGLDDPESDWVARQLAARGIDVVAVDYRLAGVPAWTGMPPSKGHHYPVASEEVARAVLWAAQTDLGVEADGWALGGASAGANLAAGAVLRLRDNGDPLPRAVLLAYPLLHFELPPLRRELAARVAAAPEEHFDPEVLQGFVRNYAGSDAALREMYAFPGGHDLDGFPPTFIINAERDSLRASGELFAAELAAAGVDVTVIRETDVVHGHLSEPDNPGAHRSIARMAEWLKSANLMGRAHILDPIGVDETPKSR